MKWRTKFDLIILLDTKMWNSIESLNDLRPLKWTRNSWNHRKSQPTDFRTSNVSTSTNSCHVVICWHPVQSWRKLLLKSLERHCIEHFDRDEHFDHNTIGLVVHPKRNYKRLNATDWENLRATIENESKQTEKVFFSSNSIKTVRFRLTSR